MSEPMRGLSGSSVSGVAAVRRLGLLVAVMASLLTSASRAAPLGKAGLRGILDGHEGGAAGDLWAEAGVGDQAMATLNQRLADVSAPYPIDLCGGSAVAEQPVDSADEAAYFPADRVSSCCGDAGAGHADRRFYISGIIGASFATLQSGGVNTAGDFPNTGRAAANLLTAGGALGTAIDREAGLLRLEVEGRGRDMLTGRTNSFQPPTPTYFYSVRAADGWSVMANAWRDWYLNDRLGFYGGGGIGAGGYRLTVDDGVVSGYGHVGGFAWQAGTGTTLRLTQRTTLDLGYRFFDTVSDGLPLTTTGAPVSAGTYQSNFYSSELLLSVRIYEPFRDRPGL